MRETSLVMTLVGVGIQFAEPGGEGGATVSHIQVGNVAESAHPEGCDALTALLGDEGGDGGGGGAHAVDEWNDLANMDENLEMFEAFFLK